MSLPSNIETNPRILGAYLAYDAQGFAWRVSRSAVGWTAFSHPYTTYGETSAKTLTEIGKKVALMGAKAP